MNIRRIILFIQEHLIVERPKDRSGEMKLTLVILVFTTSCGGIILNGSPSNSNSAFQRITNDISSMLSLQSAIGRKIDSSKQAVLRVLSNITQHLETEIESE
jgi:hypothetical protein